MPTDQVVVKLDFANAFNSLHRLDMLLAVKERLPKLYAFALSSYSQPSILYFGSFTLMSDEGPQQGDPMGPLLFSNTIQSLRVSLKSELTLSYLDDLTLGGHQSKVADPVHKVDELGRKLGLELNVSKCELIADESIEIADSLLQSFQRVAAHDASLLGLGPTFLQA